MGQAVVDLPDPLDNPNTSANISADDLLSKLAGDEIDRLLAENDEPDPAPISKTSSANLPGLEAASGFSDHSEPAALDKFGDLPDGVTGDLPEDLRGGGVRGGGGGARDGVRDEASIDASVDEMPTHASVGEVLASVRDEPEVAVPISGAANNDATEPASSHPIPAVDLDDVLNTADAARAESSHDPLGRAAVPLELGDAPGGVLSILLKPLVWFSAPLDPWPDLVRDVIGKIAVVTLVNAGGVIAYVLLFRRHHH